eukprot:1279817-Pyramimonas_sp.AAC.1
MCRSVDDYPPFSLVSGQRPLVVAPRDAAQGASSGSSRFEQVQRPLRMRLNPARQQASQHPNKERIVGLCDG